MDNKKNMYIASGIFTNIAQLIFCFVVYLLTKLTPLTSTVALVFLLIVQVLLWMISGFRFGMQKNCDKISNVLISFLTVIAPIGIITLTAYILFFFKSSPGIEWARFFFFGGSLLFWNRPLRIFSLLIKNNAYIVFLINYAVLFVSYFVGGLFAVKIKIGNKKAREQAEIRRAQREKRRKEIEKMSYTGEINREEIEQQLKKRQSNTKTVKRKKSTKKISKKRTK